MDVEDVATFGLSICAETKPDGEMTLSEAFDAGLATTPIKERASSPSLASAAPGS